MTFRSVTTPTFEEREQASARAVDLLTDLLERRRVAVNVLDLGPMGTAALIDRLLHVAAFVVETIADDRAPLTPQLVLDAIFNRIQLDDVIALTLGELSPTSKALTAEK